jgi:hypothetical protein
MTKKQMKKKVLKMFGNIVILYENEGEYKIFIENKDWFIASSGQRMKYISLNKNKFVLRDDGDLYIN